MNTARTQHALARIRAVSTCKVWTPLSPYASNPVNLHKGLTMYYVVARRGVNIRFPYFLPIIYYAFRIMSSLFAKKL